MLEAKWYTGYEDIVDVHFIRRKVFIEEQGVAPEVEIDGTDESAFHMALYDDGVPAATGRIFIDGSGDFIIGRVAVLKEYRGRGYGDFIMRLLIRACFDMGGEKQYVHAQLQAKDFYSKLGFKAYGDEYLEADIPHVNMVHEGDIQ